MLSSSTRPSSIRFAPEPCGPSRSSPASAMSSCSARSENSRSIVRNMRIPITATFTSVSATTVALRGSPSRIAISPKYAPGPTRLSSMPACRTTASPSRMTNSASPGSPSLMSSIPAGSSAICACRAIVRRWRGCTSRTVRRQPAGRRALAWLPSRPPVRAHGRPTYAPPFNSSTRTRQSRPEGRRPEARRDVRRLAIFVIRRRWWVIAVALVALPLFALYGGSVHDKLSTGGFTDPSAESSRAAAAIAKRVPVVGPVRLRRRGHGGTRHRQQPRRTCSRTRPHAAIGACDGRSHVVVVLDPGRSAPAAQPRPAPGARRRVVARQRRRQDQARRHPRSVSSRRTATSSGPASPEASRSRVSSRSRPRRTSTKADLLTGPFTLLALVIVFGSLIAAVLPLGVGLLAVLGHVRRAHVPREAHDVSVFSLNLATGLGLGLAIDYSLFVVSRYREELARGVSTPVAIGRSMQTAGRTVAFSAGTVAISLTSLAIFPIPYLRSFAYAGVAVVALAAVSSIVVLPAVLAVLGSARREVPPVQAARHDRRRLLAPSGRTRHAASRAVRTVGQRRAGPSRDPVLPAESGPLRRPGRTDVTCPAASRPNRSVSTSPAARPTPCRFKSRASTPNGSTRRSIDSPADSRSSRAWPVSTRSPASTLLLDHKVVAAPPISLAQRFAPRSRDSSGTYLSVVPDVEPLSQQGETARERPPRDARAVPLPRRRNLGAARRHQQGRPEPAALGARPHRARRPSCCCS